MHTYTIVCIELLIEGNYVQSGNSMLEIGFFTRTKMFKYHLVFIMNNTYHCIALHLYIK